MVKEDILTRYLPPLLRGDRRACRCVVEETLQSGIPANSVYLHLIWPVMAEIERLSRADKITPVQEHLATRINRTIVDRPKNNPPPPPPRHKKASVCCARDELQELGAQIITDLFESDGWEVRFLGGGLTNDDIFALIAFLTQDTNANDPIVRSIIDTILEDQKTTGAFTWNGTPGADITGAAINALSFAKNSGVEIDDSVFSGAKQYLKSTQLDDGGWGYGNSDALTTSWVMMGINSLGEDQNDWTNYSGISPWNFMADSLDDGGYYTASWDPSQTDWFATKHAIPALLSKSWPIILSIENEAKDVENNMANEPLVIDETDLLIENNEKTPQTEEESVKLVSLADEIPEIAFEIINDNNVNGNSEQKQNPEKDMFIDSFEILDDRAINELNKQDKQEGRSIKIDPDNMKITETPQSGSGVIITDPYSTDVRILMFAKKYRYVLYAGIAIMFIAGLWLIWKAIKTPSEK